jgi:hypothetical protein
MIGASLVWILSRSSTEGRARGVEEGSNAAFTLGDELGHIALDRDRARLRNIFAGANLKDTAEVRKAAESAAKVYAEIIRRQAFEDAREGNISAVDRAAWKRAFDTEMPAVGYAQGYQQAINDVVSGATEAAPHFEFSQKDIGALVEEMDKSQREFLMPAGVYSRSYAPDGKALAVALLNRAVLVTYQRARKDLRPETKAGEA